MFGLDTLHVMPTGVETRWATMENPDGLKGRGAAAKGGRKGSPARVVKAGESVVLAHASGTSGMVRRIWMTLSDRSAAMLRGIRLDFYWDGAGTPAVSAPLGDFFCQPLGQMAVFQALLFSNPEGRSFNCVAPMPFRSGMKLVLTNQTDKDLDSLFYEVDYTLGDQHGEEVLYFHAHFRREIATTMRQDYAILPAVQGRGRFLGCCLGVQANTELYFQSWWGEGEVKVYLDGDRKLPTLAGTGTEDYIGSAYGQGLYSNLFQGCHFADAAKLRYGFYRLHIPDPVYFHHDVRVTIQQIGWYGPGHIEKLAFANRTLYAADARPRKLNLRAKREGIYEREKDDWSSCAYFYLDQPSNRLAPLAGLKHRLQHLQGI